MKSRASVEVPAAINGPSMGQSLLSTIGNTPLLSLACIERDVPGVRLFAKAEWFNPGGAVKDRAAASIIADAQAQGLISAGKVLLDASSGNTGIAYAMIGAANGYPVTLCIPKNANPQVLGILRSYGAEIIGTDPLQGSDGAIRQARRLAQEHPETFVYLDQYNNPANWRAHYETTGVEVWQQTRGAVTHFIAGIGTSGTLTGAGRRLKAFNPSVRVIAVQPDAPFHGLEGMKHLDSAIIPGIYDPSLPNDTAFVSTEEAYQTLERLADQEGILAGPSSGAALVASLRTAKELAGSHASAVIVMVFPDSGARYAAEGLFGRAARSSDTHR